MCCFQERLECGIRLLGDVRKTLPALLQQRQMQTRTTLGVLDPLDISGKWRTVRNGVTNSYPRIEPFTNFILIPLSGAVSPMPVRQRVKPQALQHEISDTCRIRCVKSLG